MSRGRPGTFDSETFLEVILKYQSDVISNDGKVTPKTHPIWDIIAKQIHPDIKSNTIYSHVCNDKFSVREKLTQELRLPISLNRSTDIDENENTVNDSVISNDSINNSLNVRKFQFVITNDELNAIIEEVQYSQTTRKGKKVKRSWMRLKPGIWQTFISDKIWNTSRQKCGFNFKNHHVSNCTTYGYFNGHCNCGSILKATFTCDNKLADRVVDCEIQLGTGKCGKRWLRNPQRREIAKVLMTKTVDVYRAEEATRLMRHGDPEAPHLYSSAVLHTAKSQIKASDYLDKDPIKAIEIMMCNNYKNDIQCVSQMPFFVHYITHEQLHVYRKYFEVNGYAKISIDSSGSMIESISRPYNTPSKHIFLYQIVINTGAKQLSVGQMLSECQNTDFIHFWLMNWRRLGIPCPTEVVTDSARALLNAVVRAFSQFNSISEYCDNFKSGNLPRCYIRIDVAHFMHIYARYLKEKMPLVKTFWLASIGKLIMCRSLHEARAVIKAIFTVALSETDGDLPNGCRSTCETERQRLQSDITGISPSVTEAEEEFRPLSESDDDLLDQDCLDSDDSFTNTWTAWGSEIKKEVLEVVEVEGYHGTHINGLFFPQLVKRLEKDLRLLPAWSNVFSNDFENCRVPASSAASEGEFNKLKNGLLRSEHRLRVDEFLLKHLKFLKGVANLAQADLESSITSDENHAGNVSMESNEIPDVEQNVVEVELEVDIVEVESSKGCDHLETCEPKSSDIVTPSFASASSSRSEPNISSGCFICNDGNEPTGAHVCIVCNKAVHIIEPCSFSIEDEEGFGQKRLCFACKAGKSAKHTLDSREVENWRGLGDKAKPRSLYLGVNKEKVKDALTWTKHKSVPIIKNGNCLSLHPIKLDRKSITVSNTCSFDCILQLFVIATADNASLKEKVKSEENVPFFTLVLDILENGIRTKTYKSRAEILLKTLDCALRELDSSLNLYTLNCVYSVEALVQKLLADYPTATESNICKNDKCSIIKNSLITKSIESNIILGKNAYENIAKAFILEDTRPCFNDGCTQSRSTVLDDIGFVIMIEVCNVTNPIKFRELPVKFKHPKNDKEVELFGIIIYKGPISQTRLSVGSYGHYTTVAKRNGRWYEYDDLAEKPILRKVQENIFPILLCYLPR